MNKKYPTIEKSFVLLKPDAISRGIIGRIFQRFEEMGLKLVAARMTQGTKEMVAKHYPGNNSEWLTNLGNKTIASYDNDKKRVKEDYGTSVPIEIGRVIYKNLQKYLTEGPVIISVWEGNKAVERVRKLAGSTVPTFAEVGTLRGDYAFDTPEFAVKAGRMVFKNIVHISESAKEAEREIELWFGKKYKDLSNYERIDYIDML